MRGLNAYIHFTYFKSCCNRTNNFNQRHNASITIYTLNFSKSFEREKITVVLPHAYKHINVYYTKNNLLSRSKRSRSNIFFILLFRDLDQPSRYFPMAPYFVHSSTKADQPPNVVFGKPLKLVVSHLQYYLSQLRIRNMIISEVVFDNRPLQ